MNLKDLNWTPSTSGWYPETIGHQGPQTMRPPLPQQPMPPVQVQQLISQMLMRPPGMVTQQQPGPKKLAQALMAEGRQRPPVPRETSPAPMAPVPRQRPADPAQAANSTYTIKKGDNLTKIAKKYGTTVEALQKANGIKNKNLIFAGSTLVIPKG